METRTPNGKGPAANVRRGGETKRRRSVRREMISGSSRSRSAQQKYIGPRRGGTPGNSVVDSASARQERIHSATRRAISLLVGFRAFSVDEDSRFFISHSAKETFFSNKFEETVYKIQKRRSRKTIGEPVRVGCTPSHPLAALSDSGRAFVALSDSSVMAGLDRSLMWIGLRSPDFKLGYFYFHKIKFIDLKYSQSYGKSATF